ncbi:ATP-binding cassette domain-containing protein [Mesoflavibacter profundi]|uniref:ATP-binding cassette domain-containing protein n=1 Tax=Mesoflavibacter profundi TaxID=2708110 RepID=A0ABT4RZC8_9FLAO|nr:ATP-binding cassette domain-containing protein [Mesoflavibacter profundi]MDA0176998.1 ATP-binding cassette domain-containing protein [Mesoflavibacter profundi]
MSTLEKRLKDVFVFFENKDTVLGYRKLMDCALDTQNLDIYKQIINLTDWKSKHPNQDDIFISKCLKVLEQIALINVTAYNTFKPIVTATNITKSYGNNAFKLGPISVSINKGNVYGLVGENGNGKTTLLRVLAKEIKHTSGSLEYNFDKPIKTTFDLRSSLVYIPQRTQKWYGSLKDNLKFVLSNYNISPEENEIRVLMMICRLGLWDYKDLKWSELSSGYKMRFELARTLLRQPELLLLDEPLANLDVLAQQVILEDLKSICNSLNNPIALILSSQQLYEVEKVSDKVIYLKNGKYTDNNNSKVEQDINKQLIVEIDCNTSRATLQEIFTPIALEKLVFNGGVFIAYFNANTMFYEVLDVLGSNKVNVTYIRDISKSTRRFFVS